MLGSRKCETPNNVLHTTRISQAAMRKIERLFGCVWACDAERLVNRQLSFGISIQILKMLKLLNFFFEFLFSLF